MDRRGGGTGREGRGGESRAGAVREGAGERGIEGGGQGERGGDIINYLVKLSLKIKIFISF